jgi:hypothetical protein
MINGRGKLQNGLNGIEIKSFFVLGIAVIPDVKPGANFIHVI